MRRSLLLLGVVALLGGCQEATGPSVMQLRVMQQKWQALALADYDYEYRVVCFCAAVVTYRIEVRGNSVSRVTRTDSGEEVTARRFFTIDWLFDHALEEIDNGYDVEITFDPTYFFPTGMQVDRDKRTADDEYFQQATIVKVGA